MLGLKVTKKGEWNQSNMFMDLQKIRNVPFEGFSLGQNSIKAESKDKTSCMEIDSFVTENGNTTFSLKVTGPNRKFEKTFLKEIQKVLKPAKFEEVEVSKLDKLRSEIKRILPGAEEKFDQELNLWSYKNPEFILELTTAKYKEEEDAAE